MRSVIVRLWAAALVLVVASGAQALDVPASGDPVFDRTVELVLENFYDPAALGDFAETVREVVEDPDAPLDRQSSPAQIDEAIDTLLASLAVSHTARYRPGTTDYYELVDIFRFALRADLERLFPPRGDVRYPGIGMVAAPVGGRLFVADVYDGLPAARAGVEVGDEIVSVDGTPYDDSASFRGKEGKTVSLRLRREPGGEPIELAVRVETLRPLPAFGRAVEHSASVLVRGDRRIGYVRLWTLAGGDIIDIVGRELATGRLKDCDGLVLDLRGRWGGGAPDLAELFVGGTPPFRLIPREGEAHFANVRWDRPVVALIDEGTRSGLELFAYALKANGVPLVGTRTAGAMLAGRAFLLPDDSLLVLAVADAVIGADIRLEGRGVAPDREVPFDLPYAAGRDPQLEAAMEEAARLLDRS